MVDKQLLRKVQLAQLNILKEFKRICEENGLRYWLESGTLLGAVRHQGFIPWDDDIDVSMPREDYNKFIAIFQEQKNEKYRLRCWETEENYPYVYAKLEKVGSIFRQASDLRDDVCGIFIDIFPYDKLPRNRNLRRKQKWMMDVYSNVVMLKCGIKKWKYGNKTDIKKWFKFLPIRMAALFIPLQTAITQYKKKHTAYNHLTEEYDYFPASIMRYGKWIVEREAVETSSYIFFEDDNFMTVAEPCKYLAQHYGDYMQLPPEDVRWEGHSILEVDIGEN